MDDKVTISTFQLFQMFPDQEAARVYLEARRWPNGPACPVCNKGDRITARAGGYYRCNACKEDFTVRTGTIFERSHVPLHKWLYAMYLLVTARKGISSMQLSKQIGITQKSAWFVLGRLREACGADLKVLSGIVEIDEAYIGGLERNRHASKRKNLGRGKRGKIAVFGMRERGGRTVAMPVEDVNIATLHRAIHTHIEVGATIHSDEHQSYQCIDGLFFRREAVNHSAGEYVRDGVHTNGIESVWAVLKRGLTGVYHHASEKHLARYVNEFTFRLNEGNVERHTFQRLNDLIAAAGKRRITYKELTA